MNCSFPASVMATSITRLCRSAALSTWLVSSLCSVHLLCLDFTVAEKEEWYTAYVNITYLDPLTGATDVRGGRSLPGGGSSGVVALGPRLGGAGGRGELLVPGQDPERRRSQRLGCGRVQHGLRWYQRHHYYAPFWYGRHSGRHDPGAQRSGNHGAAGTAGGGHNAHQCRHAQPAERFRYANARDRNQRRLGDAAKKAIGKLPLRTIKKGDKETELDFDSCAVCIEAYKPNDVVRVLPCRHVFHKHCVDPWLHDHQTCPMCKMNILKALGILLNPDCSDESPPDYEFSPGGPPAGAVVGESSVVLELSQRGDTHPDVDLAPQAEENYFISSSEHHLPLSSDSDSSLNTPNVTRPEPVRSVQSRENEDERDRSATT
ncbi:RING finger protein 150-like isoform X2 [Stigmatopora argus]